MSNVTITNNNNGSVILKEGDFRDELLTFVGIATILAGTILARDSVSGKLVPYVIGGVANENGIPKAILTYPVTSTGAGDVAIRDMISGTVRAEKLVVNADGDASNITAAILDQLRDYTLISIDVQELNIVDNQ